MEKEEFEKKQLTKKTEDFSKWYTEVILKAELADYAPVKGCQVIRPYGYAIWENIKKVLDGMIAARGVKNAYFPLLIPIKLLEKEKEHVEGFSPELAIVTIGGGKELKEKLVIRPTSETIIYEMFSRWIKSWRDLPMRVNQWANVVRWEMRTRLFLRTTEFLWQEGHTVHETHEEAQEEVRRALNDYIKLYQEFFAIDGVWGKKSESEKFPGALATYTYEMLMPSGLALQGCTSHDLGQNFARPFNIRFQDRNGKIQIPWQTCWGLSTRAIGALIMVHGDNHGLVLPPKLAPIQIVIVPIFQGKPIDDKLEKKSQEIKDFLKDFRVEIDKRKEYSVGWKFNEWELRGVPLRIEIGEKEMTQNYITLVRRDTGEEKEVKIERAKTEIEKELNSIQNNLFEKSKDYLKAHTKEVSDYKEFKEIMMTEKGFIKAFWCGDPKCEAKIKEETKATTRCLLDDESKSSKKGKCIWCQKEAQEQWIFAQAY